MHSSPLHNTLCDGQTPKVALLLAWLPAVHALLLTFCPWPRACELLYTKRIQERRYHFHRYDTDRTSVLRRDYLIHRLWESGHAGKDHTARNWRQTPIDRQKKLRPLSNNAQELNAANMSLDLSPVKPQMKQWPSQHPDYNPMKTLKQKTQLSYAQKSYPQKLWDHKCFNTVVSRNNSHTVA